MRTVTLASVGNTKPSRMNASRMICPANTRNTRRISERIDISILQLVSDWRILLLFHICIFLLILLSLVDDHSRVHLHPTPGQKKNLDYINANFIDGYQKSRAFIGTQGPLPDTFDCFWRMIWEQRVAIIVMITNLVERGRRKCDMYWPKEGTETYGVIQVKLVEEEVLAMYTVRTFQIKHLKVGEIK